MEQLTLPVPPSLEAALCYHGDARYVAIYWDPVGDEAMYDDGHVIADASWDGFLAYVDHLAVAPHLSLYHLGSSESAARHHLILDRQARVFWIASAQEAVQFVRGQWPAESPSDLVAESRVTDLSQLLQEIRAMTEIHICQEEIKARIATHKAALDAMLAWLDMQPVPAAIVARDTLTHEHLPFDPDYDGL